MQLLTHYQQLLFSQDVPCGIKLTNSHSGLWFSLLHLFLGGALYVFIPILCSLPSCLPWRVQKLVGEQATDMEWFILLHLDTFSFLPSQSFSVLFLDSSLQWGNAECFAMVAMTSGNHSLPSPLKFILVLICSILGFTISREKLKYMSRTTLKPKEKQANVCYFEDPRKRERVDSSYQPAWGLMKLRIN